MEYQVKDIFEKTGLTAKQLHDFDISGLLVPSKRKGEREDGKSGYKIYSEDDLKKLYIIALFIQLGETQRRIKEYFENEDNDLHSVIETIITKTEEKKKKLECIQCFLGTVLSDMPIELYPSLRKKGLEEWSNYFNKIIPKYKEIFGKEMDEKTNSRILDVVLEIYELNKDYDKNENIIISKLDKIKSELRITDELMIGIGFLLSWNIYIRKIIAELVNDEEFADELSWIIRYNYDKVLYDTVDKIIEFSKNGSIKPADFKVQAEIDKCINHYEELHGKDMVPQCIENNIRSIDISDNSSETKKFYKDAYKEYMLKNGINVDLDA